MPVVEERGGDAVYRMYDAAMEQLYSTEYVDRSGATLACHY